MVDRFIAISAPYLQTSERRQESRGLARERAFCVLVGNPCVRYNIFNNPYEDVARSVTARDLTNS